MIDQEFVAVCPLSDLKPSEPRTIEIADRFVVVVLLDDEVYCIDDVCTHDGGTLGDGAMVDHCLACPRHGAKFDVRTGDAVTMPATEATRSYEVKVVDSTVYVKVTERDK
jgi:3-phenylpropionate/trans-cinnamate dioxygenase ferredoxin component